jgi:hypothetical protein
MPVLADHDVVMHGNAERLCDLDDRLGHVDVGLRWRRIAAWMIVHRANLASKVFERQTFQDNSMPVGAGSRDGYSICAGTR